MLRLIFFILLLSNVSGAQITVKSGLFDSNLQPISQGVIKCTLAKDTTSIVNITISSFDGKFSLPVKKDISYAIAIKHLSYVDTVITFKAPFLPSKIILSEDYDELSEIVIKHIKPKIEIKSDTTSFNLSNYIDPNDRKLKDLLEKIPGLTINPDGSLYFKGQIISRLFVEGEPFFGGGTKIGIDNIPADALKKLEIISNYSKSKILKNDRRTNEQVINLILKNKKKAIVFGDAEIATDFTAFYKLYASLFNFKIKKQNNIIINNNNLGISTLGYNDYSAMSIVDSELFRLPQNNLSSFDSDQEFSEIKDQSYLMQLRRKAKKSDWDFLFSYNDHFTLKKEESNLTFLNNNGFDNTDSNTTTKLSDIYLRTTNYLQSENKERVFALMFNFNNENSLNTTLSNSSITSRDYKATNDRNQFIINGLLEQTDKINSKINITYGIQSSIEKRDSNGLLGSNEFFLEDVISWQQSDDFIIDKRLIKNQFKTKLAVNVFYHLTDYSKLIVGSSNSFSHIKVDSEQFQALELNHILLDQVFQSKYTNETYTSDNGLSYFYKKSKIDLLVGFSTFFYSNSFDRDVKNTVSKGMILPKAELVYNPNTKNEFQFKYRQQIRLPSDDQLDTSLRVQNYYSITQGDTNLSNTHNHIFQLRYSNINLLKSYSFSSNNSYEIEDQGFNTKIDLEEINQINQYFLQRNSARYFNSNNNFTYILDKVELGNNIKFRWNERNISINDRFSKAISRTYQYSPYLRTTFKSFPNLNLSVAWSKNTLEIENETNIFNARSVNFKVDHNLLKHYYAKYSINYVTLDSRKTLNNQNFEFRYTNKLKTMDISLLAINFLQSGTNNRILQDSFTRTEILNNIMPRRLILGIKYFF